MWKDPSNNQLCAILAAQVDYFLYGGNEYFHQVVLPKIRTVFQVGTEESDNMKYLELLIIQHPEFISLLTNKYCESHEEMDSTSLRVTKRKLTEEEGAQLKRVSGQINWIANQPRPHLSFNNCMIGNSMKNPTVSDDK